MHQITFLVWAEGACEGTPPVGSYVYKDPINVLLVVYIVIKLSNVNVAKSIWQYQNWIIILYNPQPDNEWPSRKFHEIYGSLIQPLTL